MMVKHMMRVLLWLNVCFVFSDAIVVLSVVIERDVWR